MKALGLAMAVAALAAGCGGGSDTSYAEPEALASKAGCADTYTSDTTEELFVKAYGKCTVDGTEVRLYGFKDNEARDNYVKAATAFGGTYAEVQQGILTSDNADLVKRLASKVGGDVK